MNMLSQPSSEIEPRASPHGKSDSGPNLSATAIVVGGAFTCLLDDRAGESQGHHSLEAYLALLHFRPSLAGLTFLRKSTIMYLAT